MNADAALDEIDDAKNEHVGYHAEYESRREAYRKALREVDRIAGGAAARAMADWIIEQMDEGEAAERAPVGKEGARICREAGHPVSSGSWLGA